MTATEYARRDNVNPRTARNMTKKLGLGTWRQGHRDLSEAEWQKVKADIQDRPGRPAKEPKA